MLVERQVAAVRLPTECTGESETLVVFFGDMEEEFTTHPPFVYTHKYVCLLAIEAEPDGVCVRVWCPYRPTDLTTYLPTY